MLSYLFASLTGALLEPFAKAVGRIQTPVDAFLVGVSVMLIVLFALMRGTGVLAVGGLALLLTSCTQGPQKLVIRPDGTKEYYSTGGSLLTKSKGSYAVQVLPDGTVMAHGSAENNEVGMPTMSVVGGLVGQGIQEAGNLGNAALKK